MGRGARGVIHNAAVVGDEPVVSLDAVKTTFPGSRGTDMRIAIIGAGGVGGYFGARLAAAGADVTFVARGAHLARAAANRASARQPEGRSASAARERDRRSGDDRPRRRRAAHGEDVRPRGGARGRSRPLIGPDTVVVTLQNGVEAVDIVARHVGRAHVAGGVAYVAAVIAEPGVIRHTALDSLIFGELDGRRSDRLTRARGQRASAPGSARASATTSRSISGRSSRGCRSSAA